MPSLLYRSGATFLITVSEPCTRPATIPIKDDDHQVFDIQRHHDELEDHPADRSADHHDGGKGDAHADRGLHLLRNTEEDTEAEEHGENVVVHREDETTSSKSFPKSMESPSVRMPAGTEVLRVHPVEGGHQDTDCEESARGQNQDKQRFCINNRKAPELALPISSRKALIIMSAMKKAGAHADAVEERRDNPVLAGEHFRTRQNRGKRNDELNIHAHFPVDVRNCGIHHEVDDRNPARDDEHEDRQADAGMDELPHCRDGQVDHHLNQHDRQTHKKTILYVVRNRNRRAGGSARGGRWCSP